MQFRKWLMKWTIIPPFHSHKNVNQQWPNNIRGIPMLLFQLHPPRSKQARDRISKFYFLFLGVLDAWRGQCVLLLCKNCCSKSLGICAFEFCPCRKKRVAQHLDRVVYQNKNDLRNYSKIKQRLAKCWGVGVWSIPLQLKFHSLPLRLTFSLFAVKLVSYIVELSGLDLLKVGREIMP